MKINNYLGDLIRTNGGTRKEISVPRIARNSLPGTFFHIMVQGINKEYIFQQKVCKERYKKIVKDNMKIFKIKIIAYCIMNNHAHLLIHSDKMENVIKFMHNVNISYGIFYNKINNRVGYVFRDRYKTQEILHENHLKNCIVYIHKNPIKARMIQNEEEYEYSSYNEYIKNSEIVDIKFVKDILGIDKQDDFIKYILLTHRKESIEDNFIDIDTRKNLTDTEYNIFMEKYKNDGYTYRDIAKILIKDYNISEREIAKRMNLTRYKVRELLR